MDISIIIPCFNHGQFLDDAINSILACKGIEYEIIIVNDGSSDHFTKEKLKALAESGYKVISHRNRGLGYTRNAGISIARGRYILPLDADNKIKPEYIYDAVNLLDRDEADIVYANPIFFGEQNLIREYKVIDFDPVELFFGNYIDACAVFKKEVWESVDGYDENMPFQGHEDWEFWLSASIKGFKFHHINKQLYYYRISGESMSITHLQLDKNNENYEYMMIKHASSFSKIIPRCNTYSKIYRKDMNNPLRSVFKYLYRFILNMPKI